VRLTVRARCPHAVVRRAPSRSGQVARWLLIAAAALAVVPAAAQQEDSPTTLTGTLRKTRDSGSITIAYRASSIPFSYLSPRGEPIGYSIDLCKLLVEAIAEEVGRPLEIRWQAVTPESRIASISSGESDLECGSTTSNLERRKLVAFSPTIFIAGTKLLVKKGSPVRSFRDLGGRKVAVTSGTTNEAALRGLARKFKLDFVVVTAADHAASLTLLTDGQVEAFATDDVLLYGFLAQDRLHADYEVVGEFLSYDPYAIMFRKDDPQFARVVSDAFHALAADREIERRYERWFLRKLPSGVSLDLPMSPQLEQTIQSMVAGTE
jgi:glutamate/aspartate transport system substrate-binding protein